MACCCVNVRQQHTGEWNKLNIAFLIKFHNLPRTQQTGVFLDIKLRLLLSSFSRRKTTKFLGHFLHIFAMHDATCFPRKGDFTWSITLDWVFYFSPYLTQRPSSEDTFWTWPFPSPSPHFPSAPPPLPLLHLYSPPVIQVTPLLFEIYQDKKSNEHKKIRAKLSKA